MQKNIPIRKKRFLVMAIAILLLFPGCGSRSAEEATPTPVPTPVVAQKPAYTVQLGTVTKSLRLVGRVSPVNQQDLFFRADGYVQEVYAARGDFVKAEDVLARLDQPEKYEADVAAAQLAVDQAKYDLEELHRNAPIKAAEAQVALVKAGQKLAEARNLRAALGYRRSSDDLVVQKARADYAIAEKRLAEAQQEFDRVDQRKETDPRRLIALNALLDAQREAEKAQALLNSLTRPATETEIAEADAGLALAEAEYAAAKESWDQLKDGPNPHEIHLAESRVADAEARLAIARKAMEAVELRAPFDGQILSIGVAPGTQVSAFQAVLTLADPSELEVVVNPTPEEASEIGVGQAAAVQLANRPGKDLAGRVRQVPFKASSGENDLLGQDQTARIVLEDPGVSLTLGEAATVVIQLERRENVLWLPPAALRTFQGRDFVLIQDGEIQRRADVLLGLRSTDRVEILEGLRAGQVVIGQ